MINQFIICLIKLDFVQRVAKIYYFHDLVNLNQYPFFEQENEFIAFEKIELSKINNTDILNSFIKIDKNNFISPFAIFGINFEFKTLFIKSISFTRESTILTPFETSTYSNEIIIKKFKSYNEMTSSFFEVLEKKQEKVLKEIKKITGKS